MRVVVASGNIFRREFSSYVLSEAGYEISEARTAEALMSLIRGGKPAILLLDQQLDAGEPAAILRAVRLISEAPIIWMGEPARVRPLIMVDTCPAEMVQWPFRADELLAAAITLLARSSASLPSLAPRERYAGSAE